MTLSINVTDNVLVFDVVGFIARIKDTIVRFFAQEDKDPIEVEIEEPKENSPPDLGIHIKDRTEITEVIS